MAADKHRPIVEKYQDRLERGVLKPEQGQADVAGRLDDLLVRCRAEGSGRRSWRSVLGWQKTPPPRGLYVWGAVGRGKTMLMDMFHDAAPSGLSRRVHFHEFMEDIHTRLHVVRGAHRVGAIDDKDPVPVVAREVLTEQRILCFDEFQVLDIADAMILARLFGRLFAGGMGMVATSNTAPDALYENGLGRDLFLPFIDLLRTHVDVVELGGERDHRLEKLRGQRVYFVPADDAARRALDQAWHRLTGTARGRADVLINRGREIVVPVCAMGVARFRFADLCEAPLAAADYLKIAHKFHTVLIDGIPRLHRERRDAARRFVLLIDALYDNKVKLIASAAAAPDDLWTEPKKVTGVARAQSRLFEMQSNPYFALPHGHADEGS